MARMTPAELYEDNYPGPSPVCQPWRMIKYVDPAHNEVLLDYFPAVVDEVNYLAKDKTYIENELTVLTEVTPMPKRNQKKKLRESLSRFTRLTKQIEDIEYTIEWRRRHTGGYMKNSDPNKRPAGVFYVSDHGRRDERLTEGDRLFLDLDRTTVDTY